MTKNEAARRLDVEGLATEEIDVRGAIIGKHVAACVALRKKDHSGDRQCALESVLADGRRADRRQTELGGQLYKCFANPVAIELCGVTSQRVSYPVESQHVGSEL